MSACRRQAEGFTLIELLIAFSILLIGMTGVIALFSAGLSLQTAATLEFDTDAALVELAPIVRKRLRDAVVDADEPGLLTLPMEAVPGFEGLDYDLTAHAIPGVTDGYLVRVRVLPRGAREEDAIDRGFLPMRLAPTYEEMATTSPRELPREGDQR